MADITTIEEVTAGEYTVRVGKCNDGYEAVVIGNDGGGTSSKGHRIGMLAATSVAFNPSKSTDDEVLGPPVCAPHRWVAIGFAIEAYEWQQVDENTVDVSEAYDGLTVDGESVAAELVDMDLGIDAEGDE